jgi:dTDP-4-amino-4,6-dideoxygalactose transaminase
MRVFRDHGQSRKYYHKMVGWNARMDGIQGAVLRIKLKHLDAANAKRAGHAAAYDQALASAKGLIRPKVADYGKHVFHIYAVRVPERDRFIDMMKERGVACGIHYPVPLHLQEAYAGLGLGRGSFPVSERCQSELVSLPMFPDLTSDQREAVARESGACLGE